jgi:photosystem II stability/assembly factor-like uncharacterized protein
MVRVFFYLSLMKTRLLFLCLALLPLSGNAQHMLNMAITPDSTMPPWAQLMYAPNPNVEAVDRAYLEYYRHHDFVKTTHTQYYKKWRRFIEPFLLPDGHVGPTDTPPDARFEASWLPLFSASAKSVNPIWRHLGPTDTYSTFPGQLRVSWQANVYCIDQSPTNPNILFCGTEAGGVYKTTDKGLNWSHASANTLMRAVSSVRIDPENPQIVYAGDGSRVYKTTDGGSSWQVILQQTAMGVNDIAVSPADPYIVLVAGQGGLWRSTDGGSSWSKLFNESCWDIEFQPNQPSTIYILKNNPQARRCEFFKSTNSGTSFSIRESGWYQSADDTRRDDGARMTVTPADPNRIYVVLAGQSKPGDNGFIGVFSSNNAGESWSLPNPPVGGPWTAAHPNLMTLSNTNTLYQGYYNLSIAASHTNPNQLLIGGLNLWKSEDGAQSFTALGGYQGNIGWIHPDQQEIKILGNDMWVANDGGVNYSTNLFSTHESRKNGITASDFWGFGSGWNEDLLVGGRYHNGNGATRNTFPEGIFLRLGGGEAPTGYVNPGITGKAYFSDIDTRIIPQQIDQQVLSLPALSSYPGESYFAAHSSELEFHPLCYRHIYIGKDNQLWRSTDEGNSFQLLHTFAGSDGPIMHFEISRSNPDILYAFQRTSFYGATLWRSADGGATWQSRSFPAAPSQRAGTMTLSPNDEQTLWVAFGHQPNNGNKIFKTTDGGLSWQNLSSPLLDGHTIQYLFHQGGSNGALYAGTNFGVFYRDDSMGDWLLYSEGLPAATSANIIRPFYRDGKLRMATYSHGIWEAPFVTPSQPIAQPSVDKRIAYCARDTFYFDDYSILNHAGASWSWSFPGAAWVSDPLSRNPKVVYGQTGLFGVSLTVTDSSGQSSSRFIPDMITIAANGCAPDTIPGFALRLGGATTDFARGPALQTSTNTFTVSAWIKREGPQPANAGIFFTRGANSVVGLNFGNNNELRYHWNDQFWGWNSGLTVPDGEWTHVAMVVEPGRTTIYLNGVPATNTASHALQSFGADFYLGADPNHSNRRFRGQIEEVCIWNRALSRQDIRLLRHLTKTPASDPGLLAYYQFNEDTGDALDRAGLRHLSYSGNTTRISSTCPVGSGTSSFALVNGAGAYLFTGAELSLASGTPTPAGEVYVTRINIAPDQQPIDSASFPAYWVMNTYGSNAAFGPLSSLGLFDVGPLSAQAIPEAFQLYRREENGEGDTWTSLGPAASLSVGPPSVAYWSSAAQINRAGQFALSGQGSPISRTREEKAPYAYGVFPNPVVAGQALRVLTDTESACTFTLFDVQGIRLMEQQLPTGGVIDMPVLPAGTYLYRISTPQSRRYGKLVVVAP